jgi:hypothetical protein
MGLSWNLFGVTEEDCHADRVAILSTSRKDFAEFADYLDSLKNNGAVMVSSCSRRSCRR